MPRQHRVVFLGTLSLVIAIHVFLLVYGLFFSRIWGDEAYNLTLSINLAAGHGYASDGILTSGRFDFFDPRVSTGPSVLVPIAGVIALGLDPISAARIVMVIMYCGAIAGMGVLGWRIGGTGGLVLALTVPLAFDATNPSSPVQGGVDIIGEWPAAGLLAWSLVALRERPWLAGLLLGLAVQAKFVMLLSMPVLAIMLLIPSASIANRIRSIGVFSLMALAPSMVFEVVKFVILGPNGYAQWFMRFLDFLMLKKNAFIPMEKVRALLDSWFIPSRWVILIAVVIGLVGVFVALTQYGVRRGVALVRIRSDVWLSVVCAVLLIVWVGWWLQSQADYTWVRHLFPGFVPAAAGVLAGLWRAWARLVKTGSGVWRSVGYTAIVACGLILTAALFGRVWNTLHPQIPETLAEQLTVADVVREYGGDELVGPWSSMPIAVMAGLHPVPFDLPHDKNSMVLLVRDEVGWDDPTRCGIEVYGDHKYRLCEPNER